jgi:hypothetical protein
MIRRRLLRCAIALLAFGFFTSAQAGRIVVANDEWTLSNSGFFAPNDPGVFAINVASWFGGAGSNLLGFSSNFGVTGSLLANALTSAGHTWTVSTAPSLFTLANLQTYDGVFLSGDAPPGTLAAYSQILTDYVNGGGNIYVMAGTGLGGAAAEAARWNTFLGNFGLQFASSYQGIGGSIAISSSHPIFAGVDHLYQNNGNDALDIAALDPASQVLVTVNGHGLYAAYDGTVSVSEPATLGILGFLLAAFGFGMRRKA